MQDATEMLALLLQEQRKTNLLLSQSMLAQKTWLRYDEAAAYCAVSESTIAHLVSAGTLSASKPAERVAYVLRSDLDKWMAGGFKATATPKSLYSGKPKKLRQAA